MKMLILILGLSFFSSANAAFKKPHSACLSQNCQEQANKIQQELGEVFLELKEKEKQLKEIVAKNNQQTAEDLQLQEKLLLIDIDRIITRIDYLEFKFSELKAAQ
jgi:hypothetical protein